MVELYEAAFSGVNVVYTFLLCLALVYWLIVILGVIDLDAFDLDIDAGGQGVGEIDAGGDVGSELSAEGTSGGFSWLAFFNVGEAPIMFYLSIVLLSMWVVSIQTNYMIDQYGPEWTNAYQTWIAVALALPNLVFAMFVAKFAVLPFKHFSKEVRQRTNLKGKVGTVTSLEVTSEFGRVELPEQEGSLILNVRTLPGEVLTKGDAALIVEQRREGDAEYCLVTRRP